MDKYSRPGNILLTSFECDLFTTDHPNFPVPEHWHYFAEIIRVRSGSLKICRAEQVFTLSAGDAVFFNPLTQHSLDYGEPGVPSTYEVVRLDMEQFGDLPSYSPDLRGLMLEAERRGLPMVFTAKELHDNHMDNMIDMCVQEYLNRSYGYDLRIRSLLYLIYTLPSYIARNIQNPLKVEDLAAYCGLSYPWFARKFHQIYGMSCKEYIGKIRIRRVEHYLQFTDCDLNYISQHTGYADCSHLVRDFRKFRNTTPGQFRQAYRQKPQGSGQFPQNY